ncbi:KAP family P-loop NTPase fold protein [Devosia sediminis]|uniref:KAP NTPase domain-containing protein n=1 Tax=Devosia sediminis TaxID=2798801 RepID=A0A934IX48_9HYPH|nr:P-loop NTPase fold protein [Devosia sediminis]MBJ3783539.1 hypothetical protein [Devosia sediminis]
MKVYPTNLDIGDGDGFDPSKDLFGSMKLGEGLTNLVSRVEAPMVVALDGVWGSGKSTFLRMWAGELRKAEFPVIVFDAFENDYVDEAFGALARELVALSEKMTSLPTKATESLKDRSIELGGLLLRGAGRIAINVGVRAATAGLLASSDLEIAQKDVEEELSSVAEKYMESLLAKPNEQKNTVEAFRGELSELPVKFAKAKGFDKVNPLVFIIDELDRCRPIFALSVLERIKHFMSVPNVHFVLGVHMGQLEASVRAVYGSDIDAQAYLQKFVNLGVAFVDTTSRPESRRLARYAEYLKKSLAIPQDNDSPLGAASQAIVRVLERRNGSLRALERAFTVLSVAIAFTPKNQLRLGPIIGGLIVLKILEPRLFLKAKFGTLELDEVLTALELAPLGKNADRSAEWQVEWWTYCLSKELPEELKGHGQNLYQYHIDDDRAGVIAYTANEIVDRLS